MFFFLNLMIFARDKNVKTTKVRFSQKQLKIVLFEIEESGFFQNDLMNPGLFLEKSDLSSFTRIIFMADFKKSS